MGLLSKISDFLFKEDKEEKKKEELSFTSSNTTFTSSYDKKLNQLETLKPRIDRPTTDKSGRAFIRGIDTIRIRVKNDDDIKNIIFLIHQPRNHSFIHILYECGAQNIYIRDHDGFTYGNPLGKYKMELSDDEEEYIFSWELSETCPLDDHAIETYLIFDDDEGRVEVFPTQTVTIWVNEDKRMMSKEEENKLKNMFNSSTVKPEIQNKVLEAFDIDQPDKKSNVMPIGNKVEFG
jgi:hypothetical protein